MLSVFIFKVASGIMSSQPVHNASKNHYLGTDVDPTYTVSFKNMGNVLSSSSILTADYLSGIFVPECAKKYG